jgi:putative oxidoreductase
MKSTALAGRVLFSLIFLFAVPGHFQSQTIAFAAAQGVPLASIAVPASGILALLGGLSILLGYRTRLGAVALIAFLVPVTAMMHRFWTISDPMMRQLDLVMFLKNVGLVGGALMFVRFGAGEYSLDARIARRTQGASAAAIAA